MNVARWGEARPVVPDKEHNGFILEFFVNDVRMGHVYYQNNRGPFYAITQVSQFGPYAAMKYAKDVIEQVATLQAYAYETKGNA